MDCPDEFPRLAAVLRYHEPDGIVGAMRREKIVTRFGRWQDAASLDDFRFGRPCDWSTMLCLHRHPHQFTVS